MIVMMKCFYCKGEMKDDFCNYMADLNGHFIIIKHVPCHRCQQCGEVSYCGEVVARIEEIVDKLKEALTEVAIVEYAA
jgi:YgiT-type zinc finger domain-containing protein